MQIVIEELKDGLAFVKFDVDYSGYLIRVTEVFELKDAAELVSRLLQTRDLSEAIRGLSHTLRRPLEIQEGFDPKGPQSLPA